MRCSAEDHLTTECPKKRLKLCHLCASEECPKRRAENNTNDDSEIATQNENTVDDIENATNETEDTVDDETPASEESDESESETLTGEDLVIDESQQTPDMSKTLTYLPQVHQIREELVKSSSKRIRQETPPKEKTEMLSPKPKRETRKMKAKQSLADNFNQTET